MSTFTKLLANSRFYILAASVLLSVLIAAYARTTIPSDELYFIRVEQIFGFVSVIFLYVAVILTPASKLLAKKPWLQQVLFARRAVGVSAAYFALLHVYLVMTQQIGGLGGLGLLPTRFIVSFLLGVIALIILFLMAITSFDKVISVMTFKRWKKLHRFVYLAGVLIIIHVWLIGTHAEDTTVSTISVVTLSILFALEAKRIANALTTRYRLSHAKNTLLFAFLFLSLTSSLFLLPVLATNYHSEHHSGTHEGS